LWHGAFLFIGYAGDDQEEVACLLVPLEAQASRFEAGCVNGLASQKEWTAFVRPLDSGGSGRRERGFPSISKVLTFGRLQEVSPRCAAFAHRLVSSGRQVFLKVFRTSHVVGVV